MTGTGAIRHSEIGRHADQADIEVVQIGCQRSAHERRKLRVPRLLHGIVVDAVDGAAFFVAHCSTDVAGFAASARSGSDGRDNRLMMT